MSIFLTAGCGSANVNISMNQGLSNKTKTLMGPSATHKQNFVSRVLYTTISIMGAAENDRNFCVTRQAHKILHLQL